VQQSEAAAVAEALDRVYARPEFQEQTPPWLLQTISELWSSFLSWIGSLIGWSRFFAAWSPHLYRIVIALLILVCLAVAAYLVIRLLRRRFVTASRGPLPAKSAQLRAGRDAAAWEELARHAAEEGRVREAALAFYHAAVLRLEEREVVHYEPSKTPGEYGREADSEPEVGPAFARFLSLFLPLAFGGRAQADPGVLNALRSAAREVGVHA
jgi:hypothetical protein